MKKITILLAILSTFFITTKADARTITIEEIIKNFNESSYTTEMSNLLSAEIKSEDDDTNKQIKIYTDDEVIAILNYNDEYIEYKNDEETTNDEEALARAINGIWLESLIDSAIKSAGHNNKSVLAPETNNFEKYGLEIIEEEYKINSELNIETTIPLLKNMKISRNTEKINALVNDFGIEEDKEQENNNTIKNAIPIIKAEEITDKQVVLNLNILNKNEINQDGTIFCYIYRSESENGTYEKISDMAYNCIGELKVIDENLKSNTTYYYKAIANGGEIYSDIIKVTTKEEEKESNVKDEIIKPETNNNNNNNNNNKKPTNSQISNKNEQIKNPDTGQNISFMTLIFITILSIGTIIFIKKKNYFKNI